MIKDSLLDMHNKVKNRIATLEKRLGEYPEGHILCNQNGKYIKCYNIVDGKRIYIPKKQKELAQQLVQKAYISSELDELNDEEHVLSRCIKDIEKKKKETKSLQYYASIGKNPVEFENEQLNNWAKASYTRYQYNLENLRFHSISGNTVRSKSELIIDQLLFLYKIPYRYECELQVGENIFFPDFTIKHPLSGKMYYWEHFGMMDIKNYAQKTFSKLQSYAENEIYPSINLITTYETSTHPIDSSKVENIIKMYFQ